SVEPMMRRLVGENLSLVLELDQGAGHVRADPSQLDQILVNLVVNARDAMPSGGTVTIETRSVEFDDLGAAEHPGIEAGTYVLLGVSDTGIGMDSETREHVFEPFFTTKEAGKGTGLGLATIYGIVHQAGGHIWLDSEPGLGSSFNLSFPRFDAAAENARPPPPDATPMQGGGTVLLVEDEPVVREMTRQALLRSGYNVIAVADGTEAMERADRLDEPFEVLVTDVIMPNMSGIELADRMMDRYPRVGVVLVSGYTAETLGLERVIARGATFVSKPLSTAQLLVAIQEARQVRRAAPARKRTRR
ncbi:MAG TPA: ATP-binding protein, partial [Candidatus Limnocylindrales bacterium]